MVGTTPAGAGVLLVGDAAGLVNPLQGEGIAQAMASGHAAADDILAQGRTALATVTGAGCIPSQNTIAPTLLSTRA